MPATVHRLDNTSGARRALLEKAQNFFGMVPNMHGVLAESPEALEAYLKLTGLFENAALSPKERDVVYLSVALENSCDYCIPAHSFLALQLHKTDPELVEKIRTGRDLGDAKLEALRSFTILVTRKRGQLERTEIDAFLNAGYNEQAIIEVVLGVTQKTLANYVNHLLGVPLDDHFKPFAAKETEGAN